jgi:multidrug efflux pump subunit AcrB
VLLPPAVRGLGANAGFNFQLKDLNGLGHDALVAARDKVLELAAKRPELSNTRSTNLDDTAQLGVDIDDRKAGALGLATVDVNNTLSSSALGGTYVNDFLQQGARQAGVHAGRCAVSHAAAGRGPLDGAQQPGEMVPFSAFSSTRWTYGSPQLQRYNGSPSYEFVGSAAAGVSSGVAMAAVEDIMKEMPAGIGYEWTGASLQERLSGSQAPLLYAVSILFVFLCLAALYESWTVPFSVILVVPLGIVGALLGTGFRGLSNDVYFQVGLLTTVGLASKNAILIVEFATQLQERGRSVLDATLEAVRLRLRPILMTSLAFGFGVTAPGAGQRRRGGWPPGHWHRRAGRHGVGHRAGHLFCAGVLCPDSRLLCRAQGKADCQRNRSRRMSRIPLIAPRRTVVRATAASALALLALAGCTSLAPDAPHAARARHAERHERPKRA